MKTFGTLIKEMQMNPFTLQFPGDREERFIAHYNADSIPFMRIGMIIGIILYASFGLLDSYMISDITPNFYIIRYAIVIPFGIITVILTFYHSLRQYMQIFVSYVITLAGAGLVALILISNPPISYMYYAGLLLVIMGNYNLFRIRFINATITGWIILLLYIVAARFISMTPTNILISNTSFLVGTNLIGMVTGYYFEFAFRRDFYLAEELAREQEKVEMANKTLEQKVQKRTAQLIESNQALKKEIEHRVKEEEKRRETEEELHLLRKMESVGTLSSGIAHDFNNILGTILGYTDILSRKNNLDEVTKAYISQIGNASMRARDLVEQLLTFSRQMKPELKKGPLHPIIQETLDLIKPVLPENIEIQEHIDTNAGEVMVDPGQMHQVILNLCKNAQQAMQETGGRLYVELKRPDRRSEYVSLTITDTGSGIDKTDINRIFEPYFTTKPVQKGHGLGLAMVHGIIKNHKGEIHVQSEPGKGSTFEILLPAESSIQPQVHG